MYYCQRVENRLMKPIQVRVLFANSYKDLIVIMITIPIPDADVISVYIGADELVTAQNVGGIAMGFYPLQK